MQLRHALFSIAMTLPASNLFAQAAETDQFQRNCSIVDGVVVCESQADPYAGLSPTDRGKAVYAEVDQKHGPLMGYGGPGYGDSQSKFTAVITTDSGKQFTREVRLKYLENSPDGNMRIVVFDKPRDLKRHALLTISHKQGLDEQWSYDPETKQVARMNSNNAFTPFSGSEIAFEDISSQDIDKYRYEFVREENYQGKTIQIVNRFPKDRHSGYSRLETWVDADTYLVSKVDYYDKSGKLLKTLSLNGYQLYDDKYWRAQNMFMKNHQNGRSTKLTWSDYRFNTGLSKNDFNPSSLRNIN